MKKYLKESIILVIQLLMFYVLPAFAGPTDMMGVVVLLLMATFVLSVIIATVSNLKFKYLYSIIIAVLFIPSIFIYYNESALIHAVWYFFFSFLGIIIGNILYKLVRIK